MANQMIPIGKLFNVEKGELQSTKCTPGEFDFITAAEDWKTHNEYTHECEALIFAAAASGSLGRTHYVDGKFTTSDLCYILTQKDESNYPINLSFYHFVFNSLRPTLVAATKSGTSKESINQNNLKNYKIPYFDIDLQDFWIGKLKNTLVLKELLGNELTHQQTLLKKLRQQILQEAIEGKLTADWRSQNPDVEPASKLLKRIAIEKAQLVKAKKIKPQKPLPPITDEEKPFELPKGWEWCRLGDYAFFERGKFSIRPRNDPTCFGGEYPFIQIGSLNESGSLINDFKQTLNEKGFAASKLFEKGTIAVAIVGGTIGNLGILGCDMCFPDSMVGVRPNPMKNQKFIWALLRYFYPVIKKAAYQMAGQPNIKLPTLNNLVCALPPREEQAAMLSKIDKLLALCDQLESQITQNKTHAEQLMQAVLKEAFSHNSESKG
ncbi:restriction endonuclease subunit S [Laspinema olomoucense]|uniref:restriction endonuclease subunit S n=1 Tax=Laspinema olomoucense TaxID=3231600 RepID=UPI0021BAA926|nr:restriction endonuclease subunit S [Laspinema sp. D3d]MCT7972527.1 restriction endonuclease subunit S [Laspinema sp. D3d]